MTVAQVCKAFESRNILALYGRGKGHGFWLYSTTPGFITKYKAEHGWCAIEGKAILNNGIRSGNQWFWMFDDAVETFSLQVKP